VVELQIGVYGWRHKSWLGTLYPEDLPESWQLDYLSNVCRVVLVPQTEWQAWTPLAVQEMSDSIGDELKIYLALHNDLNGGVENAQTIAQLTQIISVLNSSVVGFVIWSESPFTQLTLLQRPITLLSSNVCLPGWQWHREGEWLSGHSLGLVSCLPSDGKNKVALLKSFIESLPSQLIEQAEVQEVSFVVGGESVVMQQVLELKTISELLGY